MAKFLFKANNLGISHCQCEGEPASSTSQLDCPWCGCGWLISCTNCNKAFTYGEIRETDISIQELGRREVLSRGLTPVTEEEISDWANAMTLEFERFEVGQIVVYLDGSYFSLDSQNIQFEGYFAKHKMKTLPHFEEVNQPGTLREALGHSAYWLQRELPDRE